MLNNQHIKKIKEIIEDKVKFAYIFGSATGKYFKHNSDIDLAVWLIQFPVSANYIIDLKYDIEKHINFKYDIDLIVLNNADLIITNQVISKGKIIINKDDSFTDNFIVSRQSMYFDFKIFRKNLENNLKTKVL